MEFDIVGDIHGNHEALEGLLKQLGYSRSASGWSSPQGRMLLFVGDFVDRGPAQREVVKTVRSLMDAERARAIMGNHELNAIAWHRGWRSDTAKNRAQHQAFLTQVGENSALHAELVNWFLTLPLWLDLPELRVVHACWHPPSLEYLTTRLDEGRLPEAIIEHVTVGSFNAVRRDGSRPDEHPLFIATETLLKGIEVELPEGSAFKDKDGNIRHSVRVRWWKQPPATYQEVALSDIDGEGMSNRVPDGVLRGYDEQKPLFLGHYWQTGEPAPLTPKIACVDYSAGNCGPLVAYSWRGESTLSAANFAFAGS